VMLVEQEEEKKDMVVKLTRPEEKSSGA